MSHLHPHLKSWGLPSEPASQPVPWLRTSNPVSLRRAAPAGLLPPPLFLPLSCFLDPCWGPGVGQRAGGQVGSGQKITCRMSNLLLHHVGPRTRTHDVRLFLGAPERLPRCGVGGRVKHTRKAPESVAWVTGRPSQTS